MGYGGKDVNKIERVDRVLGVAAHHLLRKDGNHRYRAPVRRDCGAFEPSLSLDDINGESGPLEQSDLGLNLRGCVRVAHRPYRAARRVWIRYRRTRADGESRRGRERFGGLGRQGGRLKNCRPRESGDPYAVRSR